MRMNGYKSYSGRDTSSLGARHASLARVYALAQEWRRRFFLVERMLAFERLLSVHSRLQAKLPVDVKVAYTYMTEEIGTRGIMQGSEDGHLCFLAYLDGDIVHYKWVAFGVAHVSELSRNIHLDSNSAYIYSSYTIPKFRGLGLDSKVTTDAFDYLDDKGIEKVYILVRHNNLPELRVIQKAGYRKIGEIRFTQVLGFRKYSFIGVTEKDFSRLKELFLLQ